MDEEHVKGHVNVHAFSLGLSNVAEEHGPLSHCVWQAVSKVTGDVVFEQGFADRFGPGEMRGMVVDQGAPRGMHPLVWVFSSRFCGYCRPSARCCCRPNACSRSGRWVRVDWLLLLLPLLSNPRVQGPVPSCHP